MAFTRRWLILPALMFSIASVSAVADVSPLHTAKQRTELLNLIRKEKFKLILPGAMRDNNVDMVIHVMRRGDPDPFRLDFGASNGYIIFTDRGDRIEKALLDMSFSWVADESVYDQVEWVFSDEEIGEYIRERDPETIAVNMSETLDQADGLSHNDYKRLVDILGDEYSPRLISSENVLSDFRVRRVTSEITTFTVLSEVQRQIMEGAIERIEPGVTSTDDVAWWSQDQLIAYGIQPPFWGSYSPGVSFSYAPNNKDNGDEEEADPPAYVYQRGDFLSWDWGLQYLNMGTDWKRNGYLLREGETDLPKGVKHAWNRGLEVRRIMRDEIKVGRTAGETLQAMADALENAGFVYTPFKDTPEDDDIIAALGRDSRSGFSIDCHTVGNTGNSEVSVGPAMAPFRDYSADRMIQPGLLFSFEFIVHTWVPELNERIAINYEDNHVVTHRGVEYLYPPNEQVILIH